MADIAAINQVVITGEDKSGDAFGSVFSNLTKLEGLAGNTAGAIQGAFAAIGAGAFAALIGSTIELESHLYNLSQSTGVSVEALSAMRTAAATSSTSLDSVGKALERFALNITTAASGTGKVADALTRLGFDAKTFSGQFTTTDQAILAVSQKLSQYADGLGKTAIAQALLGKSGAELIPFMSQLSKLGLDQVTISTQQAKAADDLTSSWALLKLQATQLAVVLSNNIVPVLQAVINGFGTFKTIALEALAALVLWPAVAGAAERALITYREAALNAALANEVLGASTTTMGRLFAGVGAGFAASFKTLFGTVASALTSVGALIFAAIAGWQIGKWASDQFIEVRLAGIALVEGMQVLWENVKLAFQVAWEFIKFGFLQGLDELKISLGQFITAVGQGFAFLPGLSGIADQVVAFGNSLQSSNAAQNVVNLSKNILALGVASAASKAEIHAAADAMVDFEIAQKVAATAPPIKPPIAPVTAKELGDATKSLDAYYKAIAALQKANADAAAAVESNSIKNQQTDLERFYQEGLVDFKTYWQQRIDLQNAALDVEETKLTQDLEAQQQLVDSIQGTINALDPTKFKTMVDYTNALTKASTDLVNAQAGMVKIEGQLIVVEGNRNQIGKDQIDILQKQYPAILQSVKSLTDQVAAQQLANDTLGMAASAVQLYKAAQDQVLVDGAAWLHLSDETIAALKNEIAARQQLAGTLKSGEDLQQQLELVKQGTDSLASGLVDIVTKGSQGFKDMWKNFVTWGLEAIAKIVAQKIALAITASISPSLASAAGNSFSASGNPLSTLFSAAGGGGGIAGGLAGLLPAGDLAAGLAGDATLPAALGAAGEGALSLASSFGTAAIAMVPVVGWIAAAGIAIYSLIQASKTPAQAKGQLQISQGTTGFEDNQFTANASTGLNIGFNDANTQQFSGQVGLALDKLVSGAIDAFEQRFSKQQSDAFAQVLGTMTFDAFEGTFTTEDFLQKYGGQALQQVVTAAFQILDPALGAVEAGFSGTADEVGTFTNTLLSIYDASKGFSDTFKANIVGALSDSTQEAADKVLAFVQIIQIFGTGLDPISATLQTLSATDIPAFIDALGGASTALSAMTFLFNNFYTSGQRLTQATTILSNDFASLGITQIPQTHQAFLDLLNSFDLTTDAGRTTYASVLALAPLFVQVHGTADQAAGSITNVSDALSSAAQSAQDFFNTNFYSAAEQQAQKLADDTKLVTDAQTALGVTIPTTVAGFRSLIESIDQTTPAGKALYASLILLAPAIFDISGASTTAAAAITTAANSIIAAAGSVYNAGVVESSAQKAVDSFNKKVDGILAQSTGDFGDKTSVKIGLFGAQINDIQQALDEAIATYGQFSNNALVVSLQDELKDFKATNSQLADELARFTILKAQYGSNIAEQLVSLQDWYTSEQDILHNNADALAALTTVFNQKWADIVAGVSTGVTGTTDQLDTLRKSILDYANSLTLGNLSPLSPQSQLADAASQYQAELAKAQGGDQGALGDITKFSDTYLNLARGVFGSSSEYTDIFDQIERDLRGVAAGPSPGAGPNGAPIPLSTPGTVAAPMVVTTSSGAAVASDASVKDLTFSFKAWVKQTTDDAIASRRALVESSSNLGQTITANADSNRKQLVQAVGSKLR